MKVHLAKLETFSSVDTHCGLKLDAFNFADFSETINHTEITCKNCMKSAKYKELKEANESMEKIKNETVADFKQSESATYKQKIEIEISFGWDFVRLGETEMDDFYLNEKGEVTQHVASGWFPYKLCIIVKKKVKQGADLIGCLCGVSEESPYLAEKHATDLNYIVYVTDFENGIYYAGSGRYSYCYPIPADKLDELKANLIKEV